MSDSALTTSQISAAGAYARAERLVVSIPVRAIDPTRQRFGVDDQVAADRAPTGPRPEGGAADGDGASSSSSGGNAATGWGRAGFGLLGAVTSFLARMFAQSDAGGETAAPAPAVQAQAGVQAYVRAAGVVDGGNYRGVEVLSPSFPRLSSGRALDLSV